MRTNSGAEHYHLRTTTVHRSASLITQRTVTRLTQSQILVQTFDTTFERVFGNQHRDLDLGGRNEERFHALARKRFKELRGHSGVRTHPYSNHRELRHLVVRGHARTCELSGYVPRNALRFEEVVAMHRK